MHLLLVDDEPSLRQLLGQHLVRLGHTVEAAASATEARTKGSAFDAAIIDWTLPDGTGLEVGQALLELSATINVIYTSGYPLDETVVLSPVHHQRVHVLQKPFLPRDLAEILKSL